MKIASAHTTPEFASSIVVQKYPPGGSQEFCHPRKSALGLEPLGEGDEILAWKISGRWWKKD